ncbi:MAG: 50S ribosomal protein L24 [Candidatus Micrarchaeaceae archaeon]
MIGSSQPRKQRFFRFNAPMHVRQHFLHSHLDKSLRAKLNIKKSSIQISKGDTVKVVTGSKKGTTGKVIMVNLRTGRINLDSIAKKNSKGKEFNISINASNVYITDLNLTDKVRAAKLKVVRVAQKAAPKATKEAKTEDEPKEGIHEDVQVRHAPHTMSETLKQ